MEDMLSSDIGEILLNRFVVIIGDSNQRSIYKDLVLHLQQDRHITEKELKKKGELSFLEDELIEGGCKESISNGTNYKEVRQYRTNVHLIRFYFVTRCYNTYMKSILKDLMVFPRPDVLIMNSCLWDITRYGSTSIVEYKKNLEELFTQFAECLPHNCLVIWNTTLPISSSARGGFLVPEIEFNTTTLRLDVLEANFYAQKVASDHGFDVLDLHFYLRHQLQLRANDGIHWNKVAHRIITSLILSHVCEAWGISLPEGSATLGSYESAHARIDYYQRQHQISQSLRRQPLLPSPFSYLGSNTFSSVSDGMLMPSYQNSLLGSGNRQFAYNQFAWQPYQDFSSSSVSDAMLMPSYQSSVFGSGNSTFAYDQFAWQPYQQFSSQGYMSSHLRSRYRPYSSRRE